MPDKLHTIQANETLETLAQRYLNNPARSLELYEYNRSRLKSGDPNVVYPGEEILIPQPLVQNQVVPSPTINQSQVILSVDKKQYYDFELVNITRSMDTIADEFLIGVVFSDSAELDLRPFDYKQVTLSADSDLIITGRSEIIDIELMEQGVYIEISGRTLAGQLIDVSILRRPYEFLNQKIDTIANLLVKPYGLSIGIDSGVDVGQPFSRTTSYLGETVFAFLSRLATQRGLFITSSLDGNLLFTQAQIDTENVAVLRENDGNFLAGRARYDSTLRYSDITLDGQRRNGQGPIRGSATDQTVLDSPINRAIVSQPILTPEGSDLDKSAKWERGKRAAESTVIDVTIDGWKRLSDNRLWRENETVLFEAPSLMIYNSTKMLIKQVNYIQDKEGEYTILSLILPNAYTLNDVQVRPWLK